MNRGQQDGLAILHPHSHDLHEGRSTMKTICAIATITLFFSGSGLAEPQIGLNIDFPIDTKMYKTTKEYFEAKIPKKVYNAYKDGKVPSSWNANGMSPEECIEYDPTEHTSLIYVPESYDGTSKFGIYLHNSPGKRGIMPAKDWQTLMDKLKLIYISPHKTENSSPSWRRIVLATDSLATVKAHYKIDDNRVYVGGLSGGGHIGMMCQMIYPEHFQGAISHAAQSYLPSKNSSGHFPGLSLSDAQSGLRKDRKWAVISGSKDANYKAILETSKEWQKGTFLYKFFDVKDMSHQNAPVAALEDALVWMGAEQQSKTTAQPAAQIYELRTWKSTSGSTIEAKLVENKASSVILEKTDGKQVTISIYNLSSVDRQYLLSVKEEK